uniref:Uncharacterized protein n=1 Tax=Ditylenchus dipsaci TaxID=166011 RepID=A0A915EBG8_9BILA
MKKKPTMSWLAAEKPGPPSDLQKRFRRPILPCLFCQGKHYSVRCNLGFQDRKDILLKQGRCPRCLKKDHQAQDCTVTCATCLSDHHRLICKRFLHPNNPNLAPIIAEFLLWLSSLYVLEFFFSEMP